MEKKHRSPSFPQLGLKEAMERMAVLYKAIGTHATTREVVARGLGYSGISGPSATVIGTLTRYGLLEGRGDEIKITPTAVAILHPHSEQEKKEAIRAAARSPELFRDLGEKFSGGTPGNELLRNYLIRNGFSEHSAEIAILAYRETLEFVGGLDASYDSAPSAAEEQRMQPPSQGAAALKNDAVVPGERQLGRWDFEDGGYLKIVVSSDVDTSAALEMVETLVGLRRKELERKHKQQIEDGEI